MTAAAAAVAACGAKAFGWACRSASSASAWPDACAAPSTPVTSTVSVLTLKRGRNVVLFAASSSK
jgi:hypothetical protein